MNYRQDNVLFGISESGSLYKMVNSGGGRPDVFIPKILPNGVEITKLISHFCEGSFKKIVIDNRIEDIQHDAFSDASAYEVVWPSSCKIIPEGCFRYSGVSAVTNIENVQTVHPFAFSYCPIVSLVWPASCDAIPEGCFRSSSIKNLSNIDHVLHIGESAFESSLMEKFVWPANCLEVPTKCFFKCQRFKEIQLPPTVSNISPLAFSDTGLLRIDWPSACKEIPLACFCGSKLQEITNISHIESIDVNAFAECSSLRKIDLSGNTIFYIGPKAFCQVKSQNIILPYYIDAGVVESLF